MSRNQDSWREPINFTKNTMVADEFEETDVGTDERFGTVEKTMNYDLFGNPVIEKTSLKNRFIIPPFSILNTVSGDWQNRKTRWQQLGIKSEVGRGGNLLKFSDTLLQPDPEKRKKYKKEDGWFQTGLTYASGTPRRDEVSLLLQGVPRKQPGLGAIVSNPEMIPGYYSKIDAGMTREEIIKQYEVSGSSLTGGTSIFDPVLCELMYFWFVPENGAILDPFAGGSARGVVANYLNYRYTGIELSGEQVDANIQQGIDITPNNPPEWFCGDSNIILDTIDKKFDFIFSCPPYYDLEVYGDDPRDLSNMSYDDFNSIYESIIKKACILLKDNRFACFVVGNVRDKNGFIKNLVGVTISAFEKCGLKFYNDLILRNAVGTSALRAKRIMKYKKMTKVHQNVLVFCKGDPKLAGSKTI